MICDEGESRSKTLNNQKDTGNNIYINHTVSILDPVLAEISCKWFGLEKCNTFDCFAGDTVFGFVSDYLGNNFIGIELRQEQVDLNNKRLSTTNSKYICDDGQNILKHIKENSQDLLFSCPPYFNLEVYSEMENDASNQETYEDFMKIIDKAFSDSIKCLKDNRFAVIVCGDIRNKNDTYYRFPDNIIDIFEKNNMFLYNELILVEPIGLNAMRANRTMQSRKCPKVHQNILIFYKSDTKQIKNIFPKIEIDEKIIKEYGSENME